MPNLEYKIGKLEIKDNELLVPFVVEHNQGVLSLYARGKLGHASIIKNMGLAEQNIVGGGHLLKTSDPSGHGLAIYCDSYYSAVPDEVLDKFGELLRKYDREQGLNLGNIFPWHFRIPLDEFWTKKS